MKYYLIDEISAPDMERVSAYLKDKGLASGLEGVFWITVPDEYLDDMRSGHADCRPYVFAVEQGDRAVKAEFFVRSSRGMKCSCSGYPDQRQVLFIIRFMDDMIENLNIRT